MDATGYFIPLLSIVFATIGMKTRGRFGRNKEDLLRSVIFRVENYYSSDQNIKEIIELGYFFVYRLF